MATAEEGGNGLKEAQEKVQNDQVKLSFQEMEHGFEDVSSLDGSQSSSSIESIESNDNKVTVPYVPYNNLQLLGVGTSDVAISSGDTKDTAFHDYIHQPLPDSSNLSTSSSGGEDSINEPDDTEDTWPLVTHDHIQQPFPDSSNLSTSSGDGEEDIREPEDTEGTLPLVTHDHIQQPFPDSSNLSTSSGDGEEDICEPEDNKGTLPLVTHDHIQQTFPDSSNLSTSSGDGEDDIPEPEDIEDTLPLVTHDNLQQVEAGSSNPCMASIPNGDDAPLAVSFGAKRPSENLDQTFIVQENNTVPSTSEARQRIYQLRLHLLLMELWLRELQRQMTVAYILVVLELLSVYFLLIVSWLF